MDLLKKIKIENNSGNDSISISFTKWYNITLNVRIIIFSCFTDAIYGIITFAFFRQGNYIFFI